MQSRSGARTADGGPCPARRCGARPRGQPTAGTPGVSEAVFRYALAEVATGHQATHHHCPARLPPVVEQRNDVRVLNASDPLRCSLEAAHELRMADHVRPEDAERDLAANRRLVRPVYLKPSSGMRWPRWPPVIKRLTITARLGSRQ